MDKKNYADSGIKISKSTISLGDEVTITYNGHLALNGAESVYAHMGYNENWDELSSIPMKKEKSGAFKVKIKVTNPGSLNICFKDGWDNWDNNHTFNYTFPVLQSEVFDNDSDTGTAKKKTKTETVEESTAKETTAKVSAAKETTTKASAAKETTAKASTAKAAHKEDTKQNVKKATGAKACTRGAKKTTKSDA